MQYINDVSINEAVIHVLDNNSDEVVFDEIGLVLTDETYEYILRHVKKCLKDEELKYAVFNSERNTIKELGEEYLSGKTGLIPVSKELASQLFAIMKSKANVPSCDLLVVSIATEYGPMLSILKMDYVKNYTHSIDVVEDKVGINIIPQFVGLPSSGQRIQKCAFLKPASDDKFDLMVIDKQPKKEDEDYGSNYFVGNYLNCTIISNERDLTKSFVKAAEKWTQTNLKDNADEAEKIRSSIKRKLKEDDTINVEQFSQEIFNGNEEASQNFSQFVKEQGVQEKVDVDKQWVETKLNRIRLKIDKDIDIYINTEAYNDSSRFEITRNGDGTINMVIKHVRNYIEK